MSQEQTPPGAHSRRPRIALLGEFSAGKSTLANLLLGQEVSPVRATATQMPPVWYRYGPRTLSRIAVDGSEQVLTEEQLADVPFEGTEAVRITLEADVLEVCDLLDMPGTSDPNMVQATWDRMVGRAEGVIWCTPATQAWRQSEAALWEQMPPQLHAHSLLLITRMDKLLTDSDKRRVLSRVRRETEGLFRAVLPISLTEALADPENPEALDHSGADQFIEAMIELIEALGMPRQDHRVLDHRVLDHGALDHGSLAAEAPAIETVEAAETPIEAAAPSRPAEAAPASAEEPRRVVPRRVAPAPGSSTRPRRRAG